MSNNILPIEQIASDIAILHQEILNSYQTKDDSKDKWHIISTMIHDKNEIFVKTFNTVIRESDRKNINLDYGMKFDQLQKRIGSEADHLMKISLIITSLHHIVYDLMSTEGNYYFMLDGKKEMQVLQKDIKYYINMSYKNELNIYFHAFMLEYALESLFNSHFYIGIDYEYSVKKIQLAQMNFEHNVALQSMIMMVSPNELEPVMTENWINLIICNDFIKKILHGSDSLDIPYMYEHMLDNDPDKIIKFTNTLIDTRFLCEYYKSNKLGSTDSKCSIYDPEPSRSAVFYFGVISEEKQQELADLLDSMPPVHDITWNIHKMPKSQVLYAQYDVIFLKYFYYQIIHMATLEVESDSAKKSVMDLYRRGLYQSTQFVYLEKRGYTFLTAKCKEEVDPVNNFMIRKPGQILKLIDVYKQVSEKLNSSDPEFDVDNISKVNYYKGPITVLVKKMVYTIISRTCRVYKDKMTLWTDKLDNQYIFDFFEKMGYDYLNQSFKNIEKTLQNRIKEICR